MLAWVLNTPLLFEDSLNVYFFNAFYIIRPFKFVIFLLKYFASFNSSNKTSYFNPIKINKFH